MGPSPFVFFVPGGLLCVLSLGMFLSRRAFARRASSADGVVVDYEIRKVRTQGRWRMRQHPVLEYAVGGQTYRLTANVGQPTPKYPVGTPLTVLYRPEQPADAIISSTLELYLGAILLAIFGSVALVCGVTFVVANR
jgi:hypothetical protein